MGVPKFFRYISERYPCLSEVIKEYQIPEFDNMYLDMNGIIHMCSHPDDNNPHFRITEERIFKDIFHYIEVLFRMIRPRKLFFMAIDGVAPRAKMNQQRGRRFRAAKDAEKQEMEARKKGETLPTEARFDSNCITPGTIFMARLHEQLKYFCMSKISTDPLWRNVSVILSGHETPGEGEHKIMDYIRYLRAQPRYDPNTRHCLYGLDADLIMLGLCTHEPHFSLLREEVKFGKKSTKRQSVPEEITFFLLHLSLMREYLEMEFDSLKKTLINFEFDLEKIIDDWVLMGFLVGNDFIPHLPHLHIANGALPILYKAYMEVLPSLDGYINEAGNLNLPRFEKFMQQLANFDFDNFDEIRDDITYMEAKTGRKFDAHSKVSTALKNLEQWVDESGQIVEMEPIEPEENAAKARRDPSLDALIQATDELDTSSDLEEDSDEEDRAFKNYKKEYYMNKLEYSKVTPEVLRDQAEGYVRAIQWNLNYYYHGCCSWSWFYPHHYAPYISDIKGFADLKLDFDLGTPFLPYEQLLAVLPAASKNLLPEVYHKLMTSDESPIKKYYPEDFQTDKNGKRQEWEAVVLIPFMDEKSLLEAMRECNKKLSEEERKRNTHGPMLIYSYSLEDHGKYDAPAYFPSIKHNYCQVQTISVESIRVPKEKLVKGLYPGVSLDVYFPGFPTFSHLKYTGELKNARVKVFEQPSRSENMIIKIQTEETDPDDFPWELVGEDVFVSWPHLIEGRVVSIQNDSTIYVTMGKGAQYNTQEVKNGKAVLKQESAGVVERYMNRLGVDVGPVKFLCKVQVMIGRKYVFTPSGQLTLEKQFSEMTANYPLQTVISKITVHDSYHTLYRNVEDVFPKAEICFILCNPYYGSQGIVLENKDISDTGRIKVGVSITGEPNFDVVKAHKEEILRTYKTLYSSASRLGMSHYLYSRITGTLYVELPNGEGGFKTVNIGLDLRFNKRNKETPGYTKKIGTTWYYTDNCTELVREYAEKFPEVFIYFADHGGKDNIKAEDVFPTDDWEEKIIELQTWLRKLPVASLERQPCGSQVTEPELVKEIENIVDEFYKTLKIDNAVMNIKPAFLYKPDLQSGTLVPDPKMQVQIFDRIVNTRKGFSVPFGAKGTIIAIADSPTNNDRDTMYDVVFDKPFDDGLQLNCSPKRGYRIPKTAFINISYGRRVYEAKIKSKEGAPVVNPWHNTNGQKFFNQFLDPPHSKPVPNDRQIPDQFRYHLQSTVSKQPHRAEESAFASFNSSPKTVLSSISGITNLLLQNCANGTINVRIDQKTNVLVERGFNANHDGEMIYNKSKQAEQLRPSDNLPLVNPRKETERPSVNTNFLKNLLKINGNEKKASTNDSQDRSTQPNLSLSNLFFEMLAKNVAKTSTSVQLLTYYQSNGLGIPRYQYFRSGDKYEAQISLPNGQLVKGRAALSKEEATENVASDVLNLMKKGIFTVAASSNDNGSSLPEPPKTWVKSPKEKSTDQALRTALQNPFVPTQVIKRQTSKPSEDRSAPAADKKMVSGPISTNDAQQKKQRKSRIAANFGKKL